MKAIAGESLATGKSVEEEAGFAATLQNTFGVQADQVAEALSRIDAAAEKAGIAPGRLQEQFMALGGTLSQVSLRGVNDVGNLATTIASIGKGLRPEQQRMVQQKLFSFLTKDPEDLRRELGMKQKDFYDETGNIKDFRGVARRYREKFIRQEGGRENALRVASQDNNLGPLAARAFLSADLEDREVAPSTAADRARRKFVDSTVGASIVDRNAAEAAKREQAGGFVAGMQDWVLKKVGGNPLLGYAVQGSVGYGVAEAMKWGFKGGPNSPAGKVIQYGGRALQALGGGSTAVGLTAIAASLGMTVGGYKLLGLDKLNELQPKISGVDAEGKPIRDEQGRAGGLLGQFEQERAGRARAVIRTVASYGKLGPEAVQSQLGPTLVGAVNRDPELQAVAQAAVNGTITEESMDRLSAVVREAMLSAARETKTEITVIIATGLEGVIAMPAEQ